jgi:hypothetical protein
LERTVTLLKCSSCGKLLTLDSEEVLQEDVVQTKGMARENMRTMTVQTNADIYDRILNLTRKEGMEANDSSKIVNELLALGLRQYNRILSEPAGS